ncbi:MAG: hypothetical protein DRQ55_09325 [Planctomycetota bacterium]|nr:MAG: hypothetical protein DRQ55_09325 [Planctomycetota bacterium]
MTTALFRSLIALIAVVAAAGACGQPEVDRSIVTLGEPDGSERYPLQYKPLQFQRYSHKGRRGENDLPQDFFAQPYSLSPQPAQVRQWRLVAAGDIMAHADLQVAAKLHRDDPAEPAGGYGWMFKQVTELFSGADVVMGNLETPVSPRAPRSGYPRFNADPFMLDALKQVGFDVLLTANNHALDQGEEGVLATQEQLDQRGLLHLGTNRPDSDKRNHLMLSIGAAHPLRIALLNYTFVVNRIPADDRILQYIPHDVDRVEVIARAIRAAKAQGAECIVVFLHWGQEYHANPSRRQRELVKGLCLQGADLIIGAGPHVIQPMERLYSREGQMLEAHEAGAREHFVAYSLGNFISHQRGMAQYGMVLELDIAKAAEGILVQNVVPHVVKSVAQKEELVSGGAVRSHDTYHLQEVPLEEFVDYVK